MGERAVKLSMILISALLFLAPFGYGYLEHGGKLDFLMELKLPQIQISPPHLTFKGFENLTFNSSTGYLRVDLVMMVNNTMNTTFTVEEISFNLTCVDQTHPGEEYLVAKGSLPSPVEVPSMESRELRIVVESTPEGSTHILSQHLDVGADPVTGEPVYIIHFVGAVKDGVLKASVYGVEISMPLTVPNLPIYFTYPIGGKS